MARRLEGSPAEEADAPPEPAVNDDTPDSGTRDRRVLRALLGRAERARKDVARFFNFVMKEEKTHARLRAAAHQRLLFDFIFFHPRCVVRMPVGFTKTFSMASITLFLVGLDPTERGAIISSSREQAEKPLSLVSDYIADEGEQFPELHLTFPELRPSRRTKDPWTQHKLVVDRPAGIRDPSLVAVGFGGKLPGARLSWIIVDDILNEENTRTPAARTKVKRWFDSTVMSRKDIEGSRIVVTNTPWHPDDLTYALEKAGWPTITMSIDGTVTIANAPDWDSEEIRPALLTRGDTYRLAAHDAAEYGAPLARYDAVRKEWVPAREGEPGAVHRDLEERIPLWPEVYPEEKIEQIRTEYAGASSELNQLYYCRTRTDDDKVREEHVEKCKRLAVRAGVHRLVHYYDGPWPTFTGVDLAIGEEEKHDKTAFFTFAALGELLVDGKMYRNLRLILDVDIGRYQGRAVVDKLIEKTTRFRSIARVETNAAQDYLRQWVLDVDVAVPIRAHTTGKNKHQRVHGVAGVFLELENGAWLIPTDPDTNRCPAPVQEWIEDVLNYKPPPAHTGDGLMASWLARAEARAQGALSYVAEDPGGGSFAALVAAR
jgi:hypothetical protein